MNVLILDADVLASELMETLISGLHSYARIHTCRTLMEACTTLAQLRPDLVICEWDLPDGLGLDLVRDVRRSDQGIPVLMVSSRVEREKVMSAARLRVQGFVPKPFKADSLQKRLRALLPEPAPASFLTGFEAMLRNVSKMQVYLPVELEPAAVLEMMDKANILSAADLAREWRKEAALTARLLDVANSSAFRRTGQPCNNLREATSLLGVRMSLNHALAQSLDIAHQLSDPYLKTLADQYRRHSIKVAETSADMARKLGLDSNECFTAGLLHCIGELSVISTAQQFIAGDGALENDEIDLALHQWSGSLGNVLKVSWRLPLPLRGLIGSCYLLRDSSERQKVVMRAAFLIAQDMGNSPECERLLGRLGMDAGHTGVET